MQSIPTAESIVEACQRAIALAPRAFPPDLPTTPLLAGAPDWYDFEGDAWKIGESVRQDLLKRTALRRDPAVQESMLAVVEHRNLRRGRQPFVMNLGYTAARTHASRIAAFLSDPDIDGQAVDTLLKMKAPGFASRVTPLLRDRHAWIRNLAKRYLSRYPDEMLEADE